MAPPEIDEGRPRQEAPSNVVPTDCHSVSLGADVLRELDALAAHVDGAFVVVVRVNGARYRRRCYLTAKAAENAARRAVERGESATVYMAELKPLWRIVAPQPAPDPALLAATVAAFTYGAGR